MKNNLIPKNNLSSIKRSFVAGENIIKLLKKDLGLTKNTNEIIQISYDLQSGSYIKNALRKRALIDARTSEIAKNINELFRPQSLMEICVGEGTILADVVLKLSKKPKEVYGFDLSWSRLKYSSLWLKAKKVDGVHLFMADLFNIPLLDNSIDVIYSSHSIEPNGGREKNALIELMRVTKKYLVLIEPSFELASEEARHRMIKHG